MVRILTNCYGDFSNQKKIGPCKYDFFDLIIILHGKIIIHIHEREIVLSAGQGILIYPHTLFFGYSVAKKSKASVHHFEISQNHKNDTFQFDRLYHCCDGYEVYKRQPQSIIKRDISRLITWNTHYQTPDLEAAKKNQLALMLFILTNGGLCESHMTTKEHQFQDLHYWLEKNLHKTISSKDLAKKSNLSESHFRVIFKQTFKLSPMDYLKKLRLLKSSRFLKETQLPIKSIASRVGYKNLLTFYRNFQKHTGMTPKDYREKYFFRENFLSSSKVDL